MMNYPIFEEPITTQRNGRDPLADALCWAGHARRADQIEFWRDACLNLLSACFHGAPAGVIRNYADAMRAARAALDSTDPS